MARTLVVHYTPRDNSNTAKLLQTYLESVPPGWDIDLLDLLETPAVPHSRATVNALLKRNFARLPLNAQEQSAVRPADNFLQRLHASEHIVVAFPFYNFSVPAAVKGWLDMVIQKDRTFEITPEGQFAGLCHDKKALVLMSSGGDYQQQALQGLNLATPLMQHCFGLMGIACEAISAFGMDVYPQRTGAILEEAQGRVRDYVRAISGGPSLA